MENIVCSFCGNSTPKEQAKDRFVAGPAAFICRDCVDLTIDVFGEKDKLWRERTINSLKAMPKVN
jgi:ATP-dependent protease Clp ATPase subunit